MKTVLLAVLSLSGLAAVMFAALPIAFRRGPKSAGSRPRDYPFVSLLKPVKNIDDGMAENLESFYRLDYPAYEVLFAVDDLSDPCVGLLADLKAAHPGIATTIIATGHPRAENPKVHKLARLEARSRGKLLWTTDSNVRVAPDALRRLVDEYLDHDAKVVFSPIRGSSSRTFASLMENASLNFFTSGSIIAAWFLGRQPILVGKSILVERAALETFGGFGYFKDYLAEDYLLGEAFVRSGFRVATNCTWVTNVNRRPRRGASSDGCRAGPSSATTSGGPSIWLEILLNPVRHRDARAGPPSGGTAGSSRPSWSRSRSSSNM